MKQLRTGFYNNYVSRFYFLISTKKTNKCMNIAIKGTYIQLILSYSDFMLLLIVDLEKIKIWMKKSDLAKSRERIYFRY